MSLFRRMGAERRELIWNGDPSAIPPNSAYSSTWSGVPVTERRALQQLTVWACVSIVADSLSMLPIGAFQKRDDARVPISPDPPLLVSPHHEITEGWPGWMHRLAYSVLMRGNAYGQIVERDRLGYAMQILPLHPDEVTPWRSKETGRIEYKVMGQRDRVPALDMLHVRGLTPPGANSIAGLSPIEYARQSIGLALAAEEFGARFFGDGANPSGVLETDKDLKKPQADLLKDQWTEAHGTRHRKPAVLSGGLKWKTITISPEESQFLETREFNAVQICGFYRVPPHMIGLTAKSTSWGSGLEEQSLGFVTYGLQPWLVRFEGALSKLLPREQYVKFNVAGLLRGRLLHRYQAYVMARNGGWLNVDEIRALEEYAPLPDEKGQDYLQPLNYKPIDEPDPRAGAGDPDDA